MGAAGLEEGAVTVTSDGLGGGVCAPAMFSWDRTRPAISPAAKMPATTNHGVRLRAPAAGGPWSRSINEPVWQPNLRKT